MTKKNPEGGDTQFQRAADIYGRPGQLRLHHIDDVPYEELRRAGFRVEVTGLTYPDAESLIKILRNEGITANFGVQCVTVSANKNTILQITSDAGFKERFSITAKKIN